MKKVHSSLIICCAIVTMLLIACQGTDQEAPAETSPEPASDSAQPQPMTGPGSGMMAHHHATLPAEYSGLSNPVAHDEESASRGEEIYTIQCASCHGDDGLGDGLAGASLDPLPAPLAHTSSMLGDDYLF